MSEEDRPPIRLHPVECLDSRLAQVSVRTPDNAPRDPDGSLRLSGRALFGTTPRVSPAGRGYEIGLRGAFLQIACERSDLDLPSSVDVVLQQGKVSESAADTDKRTTQGRAEGEAKAGVKFWAPVASFSARVAGALAHDAASETKVVVSQTVAVARRAAGGVRFGHGAEGDPRNRAACEGALQGVLLDGDWGRLTPHAGARTFGATLRLAASKEDVVVIARDAPTSSEAFAALKGEVASWIAGDALDALRDRAPAEGHDAKTGEIVLAIGGVDVDITDFAPRAAPALPAPQTPALPAPSPDGAARPARPRVPQAGKRP